MSGVSAADCGWALSWRKRTPLDGKPLLLLRITSSDVLTPLATTTTTTTKKKESGWRRL
jgi:hypothetical protein